MTQQDPRAYPPLSGTADPFTRSPSGDRSAGSHDTDQPPYTGGPPYTDQRGYAGGAPPEGTHPQGSSIYHDPRYSGSSTPLNTMAVLALVFAFVFSPLGIVFGIVGRRQIARSGERGRGLATTGLVLGSVFVVLGLAGAVTAVILAVELSSTTPTSGPTTPATIGSSASAAPTGAAPPPAAGPSLAPGAPGDATGTDPSNGISSDDVAQQILAQTNGQAADPHCPTDLPGRVGASITCTATVNDQPAQIVVTVTSVQGDTVAFDIDQK